MALFPPLKIGWLNGWIPVLVFYASYLIVLQIFPRETVQRLYDKSGWTDQQTRYARIGLPFALIALILILFTPLQIDRPIFWAGLILACIGQAGFFSALHSFNITPLDQPVTQGLYKVSRNPQWVAFTVVMLGFSLMVGSGSVLALMSVRIILNHFRILGEERALEHHYGEAYLAYKETRPRYFLFF